MRGTPTRAGTYSFRIIITSNGAQYYADCTATIDPRDSDEVTFNYTFQDGEVGEYYNDYVTFSGGVAPYTVRYSGSLPTGLRLYRSGTTIYLQIGRAHV